MEITTLIPAYRDDYLIELFHGLAEQTYKKFRVVISDDSPGQKISKMIKSGVYSKYTKFLHITLINGPRNEAENHNALIKYWAGSSPLAHVHHDDDYIFPNFYEKHVEAHKENDILLSASGRWFAKADGIPCHDPSTAELLTNAPPNFKTLDSSEVIKTLLLNTRNWVGEVTNMVISSKMWKHDPSIPHPSDPYYGLTDVSLIIKCAATGNIAYTPEKCGVYRIHDQQGTTAKKGGSWIIARLCWVSYCLQAWRDGHLSENECIMALQSALQFCSKEFNNNSVWIQLEDCLTRSNSNLIKFSQIFENFWLDLKSA